MTLKWRLSVLMSLAILAAPIAAFGQGGTAAISGTVSDESKAVLPGVSVTATELSTARVYLAITDERGEYHLANVVPGTYKVQAELPGFATAVYPSVEVLVGLNATLQFSMKLATVEETVTVTSQAPLVDTQSAGVAGNVDRRQLENMPLSGRNWLELTMLVKGITANVVTTTPGVNNQDQFNLLIDGQQVSQRIGSLAFGQVKFSRESIAEFQVVTNQYDITQGRSTGMQVQAVTKAGSNRMAGSAYGYFRDSSMNASDFITKTVLPYQNEQVGGSLGGPILRDKLFYFGTYEHEREPFTSISQPPLLPTESFALPGQNTTNISMERGDYQLSKDSHWSYRWAGHKFLDPVAQVTGTDHPSRETYNPISSNNSLVTWSRVHSSTMVSELRLGFSGFFFEYANLPELECPSLNLSLDQFIAQGATCSPFVGTPAYTFPGGLSIGPRNNQLNVFNQHNYSARYDVTRTAGKHQIKFGGEFRRVLDKGYWHNNERGVFTFGSLPPDLVQRFPAASWNNPSAWNVAGLEPYVLNFTQSFDPTGYLNNIPRPEWSTWFGDTWRPSSRFTFNYGIRWDVDWGASAPPSIVNKPIIINNGLTTADYGFYSGIRDLDDIAPRVGFTYDVGGSQKFVIRGGSGLYYSTPDSGSVYSFQLSNQEVQGQWNYSGQPDFMENPRGGVTTAQMYACINPATCMVQLPPQPVQIRARNFRNPRTWQNTIGIQSQVMPNLGVDIELVEFYWYDDRRSYDPNLFYNPATGYNLNPTTAGRPNPLYGLISYSDSTGRRDYMAMPTSVTRRFEKNLQAGVVYTLMFYYNDTRNISGNPNNQFDRDADWGRSTEFQRHTLRAYALYQLPWHLSISPTYLYGSGNYFDALIGSTSYGEPSTSNRLNLGAPITIPASLVANGQWAGPSVICTGCAAPRSGLRGLPVQRFDIRLTKDLIVGSKAKVSLIGEVYNLFNHANYGNYNTTINSPTFGQPSAYSPVTQAFLPRTGQLAVHLRF